MPSLNNTKCIINPLILSIYTYLLFDQFFFCAGVQLMRRFLRDNDLRTMAFPDEHQQFQSLLSAAATQRGTLGEMLSEDECELLLCHL